MSTYKRCLYFYSSCVIVHQNSFKYNITARPLLRRNVSIAILNALREHCAPGQGPSNTSPRHNPKAKLANDLAKKLKYAGLCKAFREINDLEWAFPAHHV